VRAIRRSSSNKQRKLLHYSKLDKGGHFPAWEQPRLFVEELRAGFKASR
jgi:pimeloyl-ACP methyl ester carboxylesterase